MAKRIGPFKKTAIIGVGLMGGSLALSLRKSAFFGEVWGFARSECSYKKLKKLAVVDHITQDMEAVVAGADIVVLAAPIYSITRYFKDIAPFLKKNVVVLDVGSTKEYIRACAVRDLPKNAYFVGCHPLCGGEKSGAEFSRSDLYANALCFIATDTISGYGFKVAACVWKAAGCNIVPVSAALHDRILAYVSHMPHAVSFALAAGLPKECYKFTGPAFKDMTRIAASPANVWADIFLSNKKNVIKSIRELMRTLKKFIVALQRNDAAAMISLIEQAHAEKK